MANMRIISDNAILRCSNITATTTAGNIPAADLASFTKARAHRATGTSVQYSLSWAAGETLSGLALGLGNLSPTTLVDVALYASNGTTVLYHSNPQLACPGPAIRLPGLTAAQSASAYALGGGVYAEVWFGAEFSGVFRADISVTDTSNLQGYVEMTGVTIGKYWEVAKMVDYGASISAPDTGKNVRMEGSGDLATTMGTRSKELLLPMSKLGTADAAKMWDLLRANGISWPSYISVFPDSPDTELRQRHQIRGKLVETPSMAYPSFNIATATLKIASI